MKRLIFSLIALMLMSAHAHGQAFEPEDLIVDSIECTGNESTDCEIIKRELYLNPGDKVNEEEIANAKIRLQLLSLFKSVELSLKKGTERGHVVLNVDVVEGRAWFAETTVSFNYSKYNGTSSRHELKVGHRNLFARGKTLQVSISPTKGYAPTPDSLTKSIEYLDPHLLGEKKYFLSAKLEQTDSRWIQSLNSTDFSVEESATKLGFNIGRRFFDFSHISLGRSGTTYTYQVFSPYISIYRYSIVDYTLDYGWNSEDDAYFPTEGSKFDFTYLRRHFNLGSDIFETLNISYKQNWSLSPKNALIFDLNHGVNLNGAVGHAGTLGLELAHQIRRGRADSSITDARIFVKPSVDYTLRKPEDGYYPPVKKITAGLLFDTNAVGTIKLISFYEGF